MTAEVVVASNFEQVLTILHEYKEKLIVIDYFAPWCAPCERFAPKFASIAKDFADSALFVKVDVDEVPEAAEAARVSTLPTFVLFYNGHRQADCEGALEEKLRSIIKDTITKISS